MNPMILCLVAIVALLAAVVVLTVGLLRVRRRVEFLAARVVVAHRPASMIVRLTLLDGSPLADVRSVPYPPPVLTRRTVLAPRRPSSW